MTPLCVYVGSKSAVKLEAVRDAFTASFEGHHSEFSIEVVGFDVASGVPEQPLGFEQTMLGAHNRAKGAYEAANMSGSDELYFCVGIENGLRVDEASGKRFDFACIVINSMRYGRSLDELEEAEDLILIESEEVLNERGIFPCDGLWAGQCKDPHILLTGKSRSDYLYSMLYKMLPLSIVSERPFHCELFSLDE